MEQDDKKTTKTPSKATAKTVAKTSKVTAKKSEKSATASSGGNAQLDGLIIKLARQHATNGISTSMLQGELEGVQSQEIADSLNRLLTAGRLSLFKDPKLGLVYKEVNPEEFTKFRGLQKEDMLIYQLIEQSGNRGIWTRDLKFKSNLQAPQITKILKVLEQRKLVKCVPLAQAKNKKIYMLFNIEPHPEVSGDMWINTEAGEIDAPFIAQLNQQTLRYIQQKGYASTEEITAFIKKTGISKVEIKTENMQTIVDTLIFDGKVEHVEDPRATGTFLGGKSSTTYYKPSKLGILGNGFTSTPCGVCPVFSLCSDEGEITPYTCIYYKEWLDW